MSTPRYIWWSYVKGMIRKYPGLCEKYSDYQTVSMTARYTDERGGTNASRSTESTALRELPETEMKEYLAVLEAVKSTRATSGGDEKIRLIRMVYWDKTHMLQGAAMAIPCAEITAKRWHGAFIRLVAFNFGLLEQG